MGGRATLATMASSKAKSASGSDVSVEVRISVQQSTKEIVLTVNSSTEELTAQISAALAGGVLSLTDHRGRTVIVPGDRIAAVELGAQTDRRVGFAT